MNLSKAKGILMSIEWLYLTVTKSTAVVCCCRCLSGLRNEDTIINSNLLSCKKKFDRNLKMRATLISKTDEKHYNISVKGARIGSEGCDINIQVIFYVLTFA